MAMIQSQEEFLEEKKRMKRMSHSAQDSWQLIQQNK